MNNLKGLKHTSTLRSGGKNVAAARNHGVLDNKKTVNTLVSQTKIKSPDYRWAEDETLFESSIKLKEFWIDHFFLCAIIWTFSSILNE